MLTASGKRPLVAVVPADPTRGAPALSGFDRARCRRHGAGTYNFVGSKDKYEGDYAGGVRSGAGTMSYSDGSVYEGQWAVGVRHGEGTFTYSNGDYYSGSWAAGAKHGQGVYFFRASLSQLYGYWGCNSFNGGCWTHVDGTTFVGTFADTTPSRPSSAGTFIMRTPRGAGNTQRVSAVSSMVGWKKVGQPSNGGAGASSHTFRRSVPPCPYIVSVAAHICRCCIRCAVGKGLQSHLESLGLRCPSAMEGMAALAPSMIAALTPAAPEEDTLANDTPENVSRARSRLSADEAGLLTWSDEWYVATKAIALASGQDMAAMLPTSRAELPDDMEDMLAQQFEEVLDERFGGATSAFWLGMLAAYRAASDDNGGLSRSGFHDMLEQIFGDLGALEAATGEVTDAFFSRADVNTNDRVSFPELVAVFEIEAMGSADLKKWIGAQTTNVVEDWLKKVARMD